MQAVSCPERSSERVNAFSQALSNFVAYCRTHVASSMALSVQTCRNYCANLGRYAVGETINDLKGAAAGRPAVLVAAEPPLARNVHLLTRPGVRERVVIIAAQTVLKPLLDRGVRPHFVTALDYHEISRRFYEGLPELNDVTLVAECKANAKVLDGYPGPVRVLQNNFLDALLGPLARPIVPIKAGSTVAHLSLYLAQHLGCDPVMMIGQDLGFSDGLYYCPGTAIHDVWAAELGPFNTLEMMEWQRIVRHKAHLRKLSDHAGRPIYSDEQMLTYLAQFERDFADAPQQIIDATEGGVPKAHTTVMPLDEALGRYATAALPALDMPPRTLDPQRLAETVAHLHRRIDEVKRLRATSRETTPLLKKMLRDQRDPRLMARHFTKLEALQTRVRELHQAFALVNELNQVGVLKRVRADRAIRVHDDADPHEKQRQQLERDRENVRWLAEACDEALRIFQAARDKAAKQLDDPALVATPCEAVKGGAA